MANVIINDTHLNNIASAIRKKNGKTTKYKPAEMATAISTIETGSGSSEWQPQADWWDIKIIIQNDTEDYASKIICLLTDFDDITTIYRQNANKVVTSDGTEYTETTTSYSHTWDRTKDKDCSLGYKTRYIIYYYNSTDITPNLKQYNNQTLYMIIKDMIFLCNYASGTGTFRDLTLLECIETINSTLKVTGYAFQYCELLSKIPELYLNENKPDLTYCFSNAMRYSNIKKINLSNFPNNIYSLNNFCNNCMVRFIDMFDTENVTNFNSSFANCYWLTEITKLNFNSATSITNMFQNCQRLRKIDEVSNIKISGLSLSSSTYLEHDTLIRILNALYDYATEGSTDTYTLTLGTTNLSKLTDEEKAIATDKGWALA